MRIGQVWIDAVSLGEALELVEELVRSGEGGSVFTPNVDHVVTAEDDSAFRSAYESASVVLADGQPLIWASRLLKTPLPEKVSGADLVWPLMEFAARRRWRVYLLGGAPGVAHAAATRFQRELGVEIAGVDCPEVPLEAASDAEDPVAERVRRAAPNLVLVALGAPKQERWIHRNAARLRPAVSFGIGAALDFVTGRLRRAPPWMSRSGLEWLHRMAQDPRRLARRYLLRDPRFLSVLWRTLLVPHPHRVQLLEAPSVSGDGSSGTVGIDPARGSPG